MFRSKQSNPITAVQILKEIEEQLLQKAQVAFDSIISSSSELKPNWKDRFFDQMEFIYSVNTARFSLREITNGFNQKPQLPQQTSKNKFLVSTIQLKQWWQKLRADKNKERLNLVTGVETPERIKVLTKMLDAEYDKQTSTYVSIENPISHETIVQLSERDGHNPEAVFHLHVGKGAESTHPSNIDMAFLERMAKVGCNPLGAIFSQDGFLRFYSLIEFSIQIYGKGVEKINEKSNEKVFRISQQKIKAKGLQNKTCKA